MNFARVRGSHNSDIDTTTYMATIDYNGNSLIMGPNSTLFYYSLIDDDFIVEMDC